MSENSLPSFRALFSALVLLALAGCTPARGPGGADRSPLAQKWLDRTKASYGNVDLDDAWDAAKSGMQAAPNDIEIRTWAGRVALAKLDYGETVRLLKGVNTSDARGLSCLRTDAVYVSSPRALELMMLLQRLYALDGPSV